MKLSDNMDKEEFVRLDLPVGAVFRDFLTGEKLKVANACCGARINECFGEPVCEKCGCFYKDTECGPNGRSAITPLCGWVNRKDNCNVIFVKTSEDPETPGLQSTGQEPMAEYISNNYPDSIVLDGLDDAIIGISTAGNVIYSVERIINVFISRDNMTPEEATEYFDYNVERALPHMTDGVPPILMNKIPV